jgi:signal transduction histidine kinase
VAAFWLLRGPAAGPDSSAPAAFAEVANPVGLLPTGLTAYVEGLDLVALQLPMLLVPVAIGQRLVRSRHDAGQRPRLVALLLAATVFALALVIGRLVWPEAGDVFDVLGSALLAAVITGTVLGVRQDEVEYAVHHAFVLAVLTMAVTGGYVLAAAVAARVGGDLPTAGAGVVAAVVALALLPVRTALQRLVDRLMHGDRRDPYSAITRLAAGTHLAPTVGDALAEVASSVASALRVPWVSAGYGTDGAERGRKPARSGSATAPLVSGAEQVGRVEVSFDASRRWRTDDQELLEALARHGGMAVHAVALATSLRASRQRLVEAQEEERRRVGRNLHDELGPSLASLTMQLGVVRGLVATDTPAGRHLARLEALARATLDDVRLVARELRPTELDQLGLAEALHRHAEGLGIDADVVVHGDRQVPAAVEAAAYRIGQQALGNVSAHSGCHRARLRLDYVDGALELAVEDDGRGFVAGSAGVLEGVGLSSMRERAAEVGGTCVVESEPGRGTSVAVRLPCAGIDTDRVAAVVS